VRAPGAAVARAAPGLVAGIIGGSDAERGFEAGLLAAAPLEAQLQELLR
jgi:hypothetical protein